MRSIIDIQKQLLPDLTDVLKKRYTILQHIMLSGTIGRRTLASSLEMTERILRSEVEFLKTQGFVEIESLGIRITNHGRILLEELEPIIKELLGMNALEEQLRLHFNLKQVFVVPGDSDHSAYTKTQLGCAGANMLRKYATKDDIIAVTGGSTMASIAQFLTSSVQLKGNMFVPARGGLGESVEFQANSIVSTMAKKTGGQYRLLHVPDHLSEEAYQSLIQEPNIQEIVGVIRQARIVVHGIGDAMTMARRRKVDSKTVSRLSEDGALAEAFGYYFNKDGLVIHKIPTVGLRLEDIQRIEVVIAVAGGHSKGEAILSILKHGHEDVLVIDEAAAREVLKRL